MTTDEYIQLNDYQIFTSKISSADKSGNPTLIFLHDSWGCTEMWGAFPEKMAEKMGLNALAYDRRGHGKSSTFEVETREKSYLNDEADFLVRLMDTLKIQNAFLYGHSDGATIALIAAAAYPSRFSALMLESPHTFMEPSGIAAVRATRDKALKTRLLKILEKFHGEKTPTLFRLWHETWLSGRFADWTIVPLLKNIACPVLAFRGENDVFDTEEQLHVLRREIPSKVTLTFISNAAHSPHKENETEILAISRY